MLFIAGKQCGRLLKSVFFMHVSVRPLLPQRLRILTQHLNSHFFIKQTSPMRKTISVFAALFFAVMLSSCTKDEASSLLTNKASDANAQVTDRGTPCSVTVVSDGPVTICGLYQNSTPCQSCCFNPAEGFTAITNPGGGTVNFTGYGESTFFITNTGISDVTVTINGLQYGIKPGDCVVGTLLDNCTVTNLAVYC